MGRGQDHVVVNQANIITQSVYRMLKLRSIIMIGI